MEYQEVAGEYWCAGPDVDEAGSRVLNIQTKLNQWATGDPHRRFDDLFNLAADPALHSVAWDRVRGNRGARTAGVDEVKPRSIMFGTEKFLTELRDELNARRFVPLPVREKLIPEKGGKLRGLGIPPLDGSNPYASQRVRPGGGLLVGRCLCARSRSPAPLVFDDPAGPEGF
jgi:hypothetical protein